MIVNNLFSTLPLQNIFLSISFRREHSKSFIIVATTLLTATLLLSPLIVSGAIIHVPEDYPLIQQAITVSSDGDEIVVSPGTYKEHDIDFMGKRITVRSTDPFSMEIVMSTVVDAEKKGRGFLFASNEDTGSILSGMDITGGFAVGGGIRCDGTSPVIDHCIIHGNNAGGGFWKYGGGIYCTGSAAVISSCILYDNRGDWGGAIRISNDSEDSVTDCYITNNSALFDGAGLDIFQSSPVVSGCVITNNSAGYGGGLYCAESANPSFSTCTFKGNSARWGGALYISVCEPQFHNVILTDNEAVWGGGVHCFSSQPMLENCVLTNNTATGAGGAVYCWGSAEPLVENCILYNDSPGEIFLLEGNIIVSYSDVEGGYEGEGNINMNPDFISFAGFDYLLSPDSPCIDSGNPSIHDAIYDADPRWPENFEDGERSDMGAFGGPGNINWLN